MRRLLAIQLSVLLIFVVLVSRLYQLQLVETESRKYRYTTDVLSTRYLYIPPLRGQIFAADATTVLARSEPTFTLSVQPGALPSPDSAERKLVLARITALANITSTLTISPSNALEQQPALRDDLIGLFGPYLFVGAQRSGDPAQLHLRVPPALILEALPLTDTYSQTLQLVTPVQQRVDAENIPPYQTLTIAENIPRDLALVIRENASMLPGVIVEIDYRRSYPQSAAVPSLSHLLGYIGRISPCELVTLNPAQSWIESMLASTSNVVRCDGLLQKPLGADLLGVPRYEYDDRVGKDGLEASFEQILRGQLGVNALLVDALNRPMGSNQIMQPARNGANLVLSIDLEFQRQTELILRRWLAEAERRRQSIPASGPFAYKSQYAPITSGAAVVIEVNTGRVLAMVSLPTYDNNVWVDQQRTDELLGLLGVSIQDPQQLAILLREAPLTNRAIAGLYPAGSTLKQFVAAIALQDAIISAQTRVRDPSRLVLQDEFAPDRSFVFPNSTPTDNGLITVSDALKVSSNVFFFTVAGGNDRQVLNLGPNDWRTSGLRITRLAEGLHWFGFGESSGIRLAGELRGLVPDATWMLVNQRRSWTTGDTYNTAIGQGNLLVTPLQLALASAAVANGGTIYRPQLVRAVIDGSGEVLSEPEPEPFRQVPVDPAYLAVVREGMRRSVTEGRNSFARDDCSGLQIAGKTGTAEFGPIVQIRSDGVQVRQSHAWFAGFAPYDNPQIEVVVLIEGAGDLGDGSAELAVPAVTEIMQAYYGVTPPDPRPAQCPALPAVTP